MIAGLSPKNSHSILARNGRLESLILAFGLGGRNRHHRYSSIVVITTISMIGIVKKERVVVVVVLVEQWLR